MDNDADVLNDDWIMNFEKNDKLYQVFYKENLYFAHLSFVYINKNFEIDKIKQDIFLMSTPNYISKTEILDIIDKASNCSNIHYRFFCSLKYNINLDSEDIGSFLKNSEKFDFFSNIQIVDDVYFDKSIQMFHDLNELIIILVEIPTHNKTKHLRLSHNNFTRRRRI
jgi:hypothetical protein